MSLFGDQLEKRRVVILCGKKKKNTVKVEVFQISF